MSNKTKIQWTDASWQPVVGCSKVSPGCLNCYAERMAYRLACMGQDKYQRVIHNPNSDFRDVGNWVGYAYCDESALDKPLHWRKPRMIFVCSMGDLFHESVPFEFIDKVMQTIALTGHCWHYGKNDPETGTEYAGHTYQILTKRPERMAEYFTDAKGRWDYFAGACIPGTVGDYIYENGWPLPNLWLGVTAENQEQADKRIPILLQIPAAVRFVSVEPMLSAVDFGDVTPDEYWCPECEKFSSAPETYICDNCSADSTDSPEDSNGQITCNDCKKVIDEEQPVCPHCGHAFATHKLPYGPFEYFTLSDREYAVMEKIDWVICGGESGPGARWCAIGDMRNVVRQCTDTGTPVFVKQIHIWDSEKNKHRLIKDINEFPEDLRIREYPNG